jgi:hypothetical protein
MVLKKPHERNDEAAALASGWEMVRHNEIVYIPADYETMSHEFVPDPSRKIWMPFDRATAEEKVYSVYGTTFERMTHSTDFLNMIRQHAPKVMAEPSSLLIRTTTGLKELRSDGQLYDPTGEFLPNTLPVVLNTDEDDTAEMLSIIEGWITPEGETDDRWKDSAKSLLYHLATALAPHWSASRFVLLIGDGSNGKSVLLKMMEQVFGNANISRVERQLMAAGSPAMHTMTNKLVNIVMDGKAKYLEDSGVEKSIVVGETVGVVLKFSNDVTPVKTNALFIEGLNKEPKSADKSGALQRRYARWQFPNTYEEDESFLEKMMSERYTGALLNLLIQHYVRREDSRVLLAQTQENLELKLQHMLNNSLAMQFIEHLEGAAPNGADSLVGMFLEELHQTFRSWRVAAGDFNSVWSEADVKAQFAPFIISGATDRKSVRVTDEDGSSRITKKAYISGLKKPTLDFLSVLRKDDAHDSTTVVEN